MEKGNKTIITKGDFFKLFEYNECYNDYGDCINDYKEQELRQDVHSILKKIFGDTIPEKCFNDPYYCNPTVDWVREIYGNIRETNPELVRVIKKLKNIKFKTENVDRETKIAAQRELFDQIWGPEMIILDKQQSFRFIAEQALEKAKKEQNEMISKVAGGKSLDSYKIADKFIEKMEKEKTSLTNAEFLTLYTGTAMGNPKVVLDACLKVFGWTFAKYHAYDSLRSLCEMSEQFRARIDANNPDLANAVRQLGEFDYDEDRDVMRQISEYVREFGRITGSRRVVVNRQVEYDYLRDLHNEGCSVM